MLEVNSKLCASAEEYVESGSAGTHMQGPLVGTNHSGIRHLEALKFVWLLYSHTSTTQRGTKGP